MPSAPLLDARPSASAPSTFHNKESLVQPASAATSPHSPKPNTDLVPNATFLLSTAIYGDDSRTTTESDSENISCSLSSVMTSMRYRFPSDDLELTQALLTKLRRQTFKLQLALLVNLHPLRHHAIVTACMLQPQQVP